MRHNYDYIPRKHIELFEIRNLNELKKIYSIIKEFMNDAGINIGGLQVTKKAEIIKSIMDVLNDDDNLKIIFKSLTEIEQNALKEAIYSGDNRLDMFLFKIKYGTDNIYRKQEKYSYFSSYSHISPIELFLTRRFIIPEDISNRLKTFVEKPKGHKVIYESDIPETYDLHSYKGKLNVKIKVHETELASLHDLPMILNLIKDKSISVSSSTSRVTKSGAKKISKVLINGDFYEEEDFASLFRYPEIKFGEIGIKPFAWALILQAGNLAQQDGSKLSLSRKGERSLNKPSHEVIKDLWERWLKTNIINELNRIEVIKGQKSKSRPIYQPMDARRSIASALSKLDIGEWIHIDDLIKNLSLGGNFFDVVRDYYKIYIEDPMYGYLDQGDTKTQWNVTNGRFLRAFLLEYAATLGIIDVGIVPPWGAVSDFTSLWGTEDLLCISRYDGLLYIRLTNLGAYVLEKIRDYKPPQFEDKALFEVLPNFDIVIKGSNVKPAEEFMLEKFARKVSDRTWTISKDDILLSLQKGTDINEIIDFMKAKSDKDELPESVMKFIEDIEANQNKLKYHSNAIIIECSDPRLAMLIANEKEIKKHCMIANERYLVVDEKKETVLKKVIRDLGYVL